MAEQNHLSDANFLRMISTYSLGPPSRGRLRAIADRLEVEDKPTPFEKMSAGEQLAHLGTDAAKWAAAFIGTVRRSKPGMATDWGAMVGWFASAIEAGRTAGLAMSTEDVKSEAPALGLPALLTECPYSAPPSACTACHGTGKVLTPAGEQVAELLAWGEAQ